MGFFFFIFRVKLKLYEKEEKGSVELDVGKRPFRNTYS